MLKLKTHSGVHDLFRFWYISEYKYGSILWLEDGNLYLRLRKMSHTIYAANGKVSHILTNTVVYFDWKMVIYIYFWNKYGSILWLEDGNLYLRLVKMSHTIYAANGKVIHIHREYGSILWLEDGNLYLRLRTVVYFDWKTVIYIYICGQCTHNLCCQWKSQSHSPAHVLILCCQWKSQSHSPAHVLIFMLPMEKSVKCIGACANEIIPNG